MNKRLHQIYIGSFFFVGSVVLVLLAINGYEYYSTPLEERFFNPDHTALKPSGGWGLGFGIVGTLMMIVGVSVYMIRRCFPKSRFIGEGVNKSFLPFLIRVDLIL
ncbi:MAG: hypothetical protein IIA49_03205 [Bacteroidetes bacterium]|nr:hypothetical protein [Bacteroidota bacterium]